MLIIVIGAVFVTTAQGSQKRFFKGSDTWGRNIRLPGGQGHRGEQCSTSTRLGQRRDHILYGGNALMI